MAATSRTIQILIVQSSEVPKSPSPKLCLILSFSLKMTAQGSLRGFGQNLQGRFFAEGNQIEVTGSFSQSVDNFDAPSVTLTYEDLADLQGTYNIVIDVPPSYVGAADLSLNLKNVQNKTASISGPMVPPTSGRQSVSGFVRFGWAM
ncbi:hypothetical protein RU639_002478 [Aspergillus parasiticus]